MRRRHTDKATEGIARYESFQRAQVHAAAGRYRQALEGYEEAGALQNAALMRQALGVTVARRALVATQVL
jgi:hypothetical protein